MKLKLKKIDKDQALELATAHVEKAVFAVLVIGFLLFCLGAIKQKPYDKTPTEFDTLSRNVTDKIARSVFDPATDVPPAKDLPEAQEVPPKLFETAINWNRPVNDVKKRRSEPKYLAVQDLRVASDYGAVPVRVPADQAGDEAPRKKPAAAAPPPPGGIGGGGGLGAAARGLADVGPRQAELPTGSAVKGKQWAVITGLVPLASQVKEYRSTFRDVRQAYANLDYPDYESYEVERAEVLPGSADNADPKWAAIDRKQAEADEETIAEYAQDPIDASLEDPVYSQKPPKIIGKEHGKSIIHPKIPRGPQGDARGGNVVAQPAARAGGMGGGLGAAAARGAAIGNNPQAGGGDSASKGPKVDYKLFRCFDFSVQPGKSYRYRVRLELHNPNHNVPSQYLTSAQLNKGETRFAPWSEPSDVVSIPRGSSLVAGGILRARSSTEQKAEVLVRMWDQKEAVDASKVAEVVRGQIANFAVEDTPINERGETRPIPFQTDTLVLDMAGGETLSGVPRAKALGQLLVLEPNGQLSVKSELADAEIYEPTKKRLKEWQDAIKPEASTSDSADDSDSKSKKKKGEPARSGPGLSGLGGAAAAAAAAGGKASRPARGQ
jgi:hypothetical protein